VVGGTIRSVDNKEALAVRGVQQTVNIDAPKPPLLFQPLGGVAVIANSTWAAFQGRKRLKIDWQDGPHANFESEAFRKQLIDTVSHPAKVVRNVGNVDTEFAKGGKVLEATDTAWRCFREKIQTGLRCGSGHPVEETRKTGEGRLDSRG
jgi:isoquinoline 1-oxidoreductase beta subunit